MKEYQARVHDLVVFTFLRGQLHQHIYRVSSIQLGGVMQEGAIELEPVSHEQSTVYNHGNINSYIPPLLFERMVRLGMLECVWRKPE